MSRWCIFFNLIYNVSVNGRLGCLSNLDSNKKTWNKDHTPASVHTEENGKVEKSKKFSQRWRLDCSTDLTRQVWKYFHISHCLTVLILNASEAVVIIFGVNISWLVLASTFFFFFQSEYEHALPSLLSASFQNRATITTHSVPYLPDQHSNTPSHTHTHTGLHARKHHTTPTWKKHA